MITEAPSPATFSWYQNRAGRNCCLAFRQLNALELGVAGMVLLASVLLALSSVIGGHWTGWAAILAYFAMGISDGLGSHNRVFESTWAEHGFVVSSGEARRMVQPCSKYGETT